ncbi:MAG: DUF742 domain-containing protein [Acidimicrobiales bacterium]
MISHEGPTDADTERTLVRPYALVRGRTRAGAAASLPVEAVIVTDADVASPDLILEPAAIVRLCRRPYSVAEVSGLLHLPVGVVRVLVADLADAGFVHVNLPLGPQADGTMDRVLLERVLAGLEAL